MFVPEKETPVINYLSNITSQENMAARGEDFRHFGLAAETLGAWVSSNMLQYVIDIIKTISATTNNFLTNLLEKY